MKSGQAIRTSSQRDEPACSPTNRLVLLLLGATLVLTAGACTRTGQQTTGPVRMRVATYNIEDVRTTDLLAPHHPRLRLAAATIQSIRPDVLLVNEMAYDNAGVPGYSESEGPGQNARRFVEGFLSIPQDSGLTPIRYRAISFPTNTGLASGFDLDNNGVVVTDFPTPEAASASGSAPRQTPEQRAYGGDTWGFGTFPGQYAMALFVSDRFEILMSEVRSFQEFRWKDMPDARAPSDPESGEPWYSSAEWEVMRLSSKNHVDVPIRLENGSVLHLLISHPTPPAFDGAEMRNKMRNHDEIRFWTDYVVGAGYMVDDRGVSGGLNQGESFIILGDLNADPDEGRSIRGAISSLLSANQVNGSFVPVATQAGVDAYSDLDPDDTAEWGLRVDYVLPSSNLEVLAGGVWRPVRDGLRASDHFPVFLDLVVPPARGAADMPKASSETPAGN